MNKTQFIDRLAAQENITKKDAKRFVEAFLYLLEQSFYNREEVRFPSFGTFSFGRRKARVIENFALTGETINVPAKDFVKFRPSKHIVENMKETQGEKQ